MIKYEKAHAGEEEKLVDFGNYVFSQSARPHDFRALLPKVYNKGVKSASFHFVAHDESDNIRAMVCCLPQPIKICGLPLLLGTVGTVSVHPYARGEGHMKHIMKLMHADARAQGMDALVLGGRRQRYNYFGYEHAGANAIFTLNRDNLRHALGQEDASGITLQIVGQDDQALLNECYALYENGPVCGARPRERYLDYLHSWNGDLVAVHRGGHMIGALQESGCPRRIGELLLKDEADLKAVIKAWMLERPETESTRLTVWPFEHERLRIMQDIAEDMEIGISQMLCVLNFQNVLRALLTLNAQCKALEDGSVSLLIEGEQLRVAVKGGAVSVAPTLDEPEFTLTRLEAERLFFLPTRFLEPGPAAFKNWLPLPWVMPSPDHF